MYENLKANIGWKNSSRIAISQRKVTKKIIDIKGVDALKNSKEV